MALFSSRILKKVPVVERSLSREDFVRPANFVPRVADTAWKNITLNGLCHSM
jgi:hypothetical protein